MSVTAVSSAAALTTTTSSAKALEKNGKGEYTASSVSDNQAAAAKLELIKQPDGNYGTTAAKTPDTSKGASASSSSSVQAALNNLTLGG